MSRNIFQILTILEEFLPEGVFLGDKAPLPLPPLLGRLDHLVHHVLLLLVLGLGEGGGLHCLDGGHLLQGERRKGEPR